MKSIKQQYIDLKEGRMSQHNFMRSVRMSLPQYITNVTSFNDTVKILKNKGILNEATVNSSEDVKEQWFEEFQNAIENMNLSPEKKTKVMKALDHVDAVDLYGMFQPGPGANAFIGDIDDILARAGDEGLDEAYADEAPSYDYNGKKLYVDNQSGEPDEVGGKVSLYDEDKNEYVGIISSIDGEGIISVDPKSIQPVEDSELASILAKYGDEDLDGLSPEDYKFQDVEGGISEEKLDEYEHTYRKINGVCYKIDDEGNRTRVADHYCRYGEGLSEAKKKKEAKAELHPNQIHPQELRMGIKVELEHTDDLDKAKKIALDHLAENPFYYTALKLAGVESPSSPKVKAPVEKKVRKKKEAVELVDKANAMQKVKMPKALKEAKFNLFPGEEPNTVVKQAIEWVEANLPSISDEIEFQQSRFRPDEAILRYEYWDILPEDAVAKLKSKFDVEADSDEMDDQLPINYYRLKLKKSSFRPGVNLGKYDLKSLLEDIVREVVAETFDGRDNLDAENEY